MLISQVDQFLSKPEDFVGGATNIVIATYGQIEGYPNGITERETKGGGRLRIVSGGGMFNGINFGFARIPDPDVRKVQATKDAGLSKVSEELSSAIPESTFIILYAGTSRLGKVVDLGISLAEKGARVALLSCGCDDPRDFSRIDGSVGKDNLSVLMPNHPGWCDSEYKDLGRIASALLA